MERKQVYRVRLEKCKNPRGPGTLTTEDMPRENGATPVLLLPHLSAQHHSCTWHLNKRCYLMMHVGLSSHLGLGFRKLQSPELQGH